MDYTQVIGTSNELLCITEFIKMGYDCSVPFGNSAKYDFIADINGRLLRFQCKTSHYVSKNGIIDYDAIEFCCLSQTTTRSKISKYKYSIKDIDYFCTYFNGNVYIVPVEECSNLKRLRFSPPKNGQKNYNNAEDYLLSKFVSYSDSYISSKKVYEKRVKNQWELT